MKNRISVLFSVILGALLITSCSNVFQPNKKVADIEVKASLSGTMARGPVSREGDPYSFIDDDLYSSNYEDTFTYYQIITKLTGSPYNLSKDAAYDVLAEKLMENSDFGSYNNCWMQIKTNFGQESEKVNPYAKQVDLIKSYYKAAIKPAYIYYSFLDEAGILLSDGQLDLEALKDYFTNNLAAIEKYNSLQQEYNASLETSLPDESNFALTTVSLKLNSVPFDQEVSFTLIICFTEKEGPIEYPPFTRFVNPGLNVFDIQPNELQPSSDSGSGGDDEGDTDPDQDQDPDTDPVVDPWKDYTTYYVSNSADEGATGSKDDPMSLIAAFEECTDSYKEKGTKYAIILTDDITLSETLTVQPSAYVVITGNYVTPTKTIYTGEGFKDWFFSIDNYANLGLSSVILQGNGNCQLFYCSQSESEDETVTVSEGDTVTVSEGDTETATNRLTGTFTMENCTVTDFLGTEKAGIITMATGGKMDITGCTFNNNIVGAAGAIYLISGTLNLNIEGLLDSSLSSLSRTNSFYDTSVDSSPCEIYLKGTGTFNETNLFVNPLINAVHVAGWTTLTLYGKYYSSYNNALKIYSTTDGSISNEKSKNTINVDDKEKVTIDDGGDVNKETPTYTISILKSTN